MNTFPAEPIRPSSSILAHLNDEYFSVLGAFIYEQERSVNLMNHWKLKHALRKLGYHAFIIELVSQANDSNGSSLYFFVPNLSYEKALDLGAEFGQEAILAKINEEVLVLGKVNPREGDGRVIKRFSASPLSGSGFLDAFIQLLNTSNNHTGNNTPILHELTRVPLQCSHHLEYPYARCYTFK